MGRGFGAAIISLGLSVSPVLGADIAVEVSSGEILTATDADSPHLPASLTKLMTAYVAFKALAAGELAAEQPLTVSRFAAQRPPVKLGLKVGAQVPFSEILNAAVVGSKNDAATLVAEAVSGSETAFVAKMNEAAMLLGMTNTVFVNATGLPAAGQRTTARDVALLSRALLTQFPLRSRIFSRRSVTALGKRVATTNPLFGRVTGAEGLKTGFTCAAGYTISALVERHGRRIIAVTLGHQSKSKRLRAVKGLIEAAFQLSGSGEVLAAGQRSRLAPTNVRACGAVTASVQATDISPEEIALYAAELAKARRRKAVSRSQNALPLNAPSPTAPPRLSGWAVFLGAHDTEQAARSAIRAFRLRIGKQGVGRTELRSRDGRVLALIHRLDQNTASASCRASRRYCLVLPPERVLNRRAQWRR